MLKTRTDLTSDQLEFFDTEGYLIVEDVFDPEHDFKLLEAELSNVLDHLAARLLKSREIESYNQNASFEQRVLELVQTLGSFPIQHFDFSLPQKGIQADTPMYLGEGAFRVLTHPILLDLVESIVGPEITVSPVQHIRIKTPVLAKEDSGTWDGTPQANLTTPPHQDIGVSIPEADASEVLTVWLPITDATAEMGCLGVWPRRHKDGVLGHCGSLEGLRIPEQFLDPNECVSLPMKAGSVLLMTRNTPHHALQNLSKKVRWSMDLRYQPTGQLSGRPMFPDFVARSATEQHSVLTDHNVWRELWLEARADLSGDSALSFNRWKDDAPWCA